MAAAKPRNHGTEGPQGGAGASGQCSLWPITAADVTKKATSKDSASLGNCPAQVLHKNQPGLRGQRKVSWSRGKELIKPNWEVLAFTAVPTQSRSQAWGRTGWESFPCLCLYYPEPLLEWRKSTPHPSMGSACLTWDLPHSEVFQKET